MGRLPNLLRLGSKLVLEILPSIAATVIGGYLLTQLHFSRTPQAPPAAGRGRPGRALARWGSGRAARERGARRNPRRSQGAARKSAGPRSRPAQAGDDR